MGNHMSKNTAEPSSPSNLRLRIELDSYESACRLDSDLQSFDTSLQTRTNDIINSLAYGVEVRALSFNSLKQVTGCLLDMNQEVVKVILDCKKDIWKNQDLFELVEEYFENSLKTLDFCAALDRCLKSVRDSQLLVHIALQRFEEESKNNAEEEGAQRFSKTLMDLKNFKEFGDPFTEEFYAILQSVYRQQVAMLEKLHLKKAKLDRKLKRVHAWRKVSCFIFAAAFASVLICSVVAAAVAAPPVAAALAAASSIPVGSMGKWIDSLLKNYEDAVKGQKELVNCMSVGTYVAIKDLDTIRILVDRLEIEIHAITNCADFSNEDEYALKISVEAIARYLEVFVTNTELLVAQADSCSRDIRRARTVILQRIIKTPSN